MCSTGTPKQRLPVARSLAMRLSAKLVRSGRVNLLRIGSLSSAPPVLAVGLISFSSVLSLALFCKTRIIKKPARALMFDSHLCRTWLAGTASRPVAARDAGWTPVAVALGPNPPRSKSPSSPPVEEASPNPPPVRTQVSSYPRRRR